MNYELAKQLKEAGFPQEENEGKILCPHRGWSCNKGCKEKDWIYHPTLSELIEACGDEFIKLEKHVEWEAEAYITDKEGKHIAELYGKSPEEAVAKLWLKLNEE